MVLRIHNLSSNSILPLTITSLNDLFVACWKVQSISLFFMQFGILKFHLKYSRGSKIKKHQNLFSLINFMIGFSSHFFNHFTEVHFLFLQLFMRFWDFKLVVSKIVFCKVRLVYPCSFRPVNNIILSDLWISK